LKLSIYSSVYVYGVCCQGLFREEWTFLFFSSSVICFFCQYFSQYSSWFNFSNAFLSNQSQYKTKWKLLWFLWCVYYSFLTISRKFQRIARVCTVLKLLILVYVKWYILAGTVNCWKLTDILSRMCILFTGIQDISVCPMVVTYNEIHHYRDVLQRFLISML